MWLFDDAFDVQFQQFGFDPQPGGEPFPAAVAEASRPAIFDMSLLIRGARAARPWYTG